MADGSTSDPPSKSWGPGFIGLVLSVFTYGSGVCQWFFYSYHFPGDRALLKTTVTLTVAMDTVHVFGCVQLYWRLLVACRRDLSPRCQTELPLTFSLAVLMNYCITFVVQCFYVHRVWIVSGNHRLLTILAIIAATVGFIIGLVCSIQTFQQQTINFIFTTPLVASSAVVSTICDGIITCSVVYFLRTSQPKAILRRARFVQRIVRVSVNSGLLTCVVSLTTAVLYSIQGGKYWVEITGVVLCRSYVNSMLAVLNARQSIRDRERDFRDRTIEVPSVRIQ